MGGGRFSGGGGAFLTSLPPLGLGPVTYYGYTDFPIDIFLLSMVIHLGEILDSSLSSSLALCYDNLLCLFIDKLIYVWLEVQLVNHMLLLTKEVA